MLSAVFVGQGVETFLSPAPAVEAARPVADGLQHLPESVSSNLPQSAETLAKLTAAVQIGGGLLLATGKVPRLASAALAATIIPANFGRTMFWTEPDPQRRAEQRRAFVTDVSLLGGLMIAAADTAGKPSLGWRGRRAAAKLGDTVAAALPSGSESELAERADALGHRLQEGLHVGAERGRELAVLAAERSAPLLEAARERGTELAGVAAHRGAELAEVARERGTELAEVAAHRGAELADTARHGGEELAETARQRVRSWRQR